MLLNEYQVNENTLNGELSSESQETLLYIEKSIGYKVSAVSSTLLSIEKKIKTIGSGTFLAIEKRIVSAAATNTFYSRNGWEPIITLGGLTVSADQLHSSILVSKQEEDNHIARFTLVLDPDVYDLYNFQGKDVVIYIRKSGVTTRLFTGIVDIPEVDAINEKLTLNCISDRRTLIANLSLTEPYIGYYSDTILGTNTDTYERISARLSTIPYSLDFDSYNNMSLTSWTPKASADFTYGSSGVYRRDPQLKIESAAKLVNRINLQMEFGYQRLHHREAAYTWEHTYAPNDPVNGLGGICPFLSVRPTMPTKEMIRQAIAGAGWPVRTGPSFGRQFKSGAYQCSGVWAFWSTVETSYLNAPVVDSSGAAQLDASGNPLYRSVQTVVADNTELYTMNADWTATTRFNQNVKETYNVTVNASTSQSIYGVISNTENYGYTSINEFRDWEDYNSYESPPAGYTTVPANPTTNYYINGDQERYRFNQAFACALNKAKTSILKTHRDTTITFQRDLEPTLELKHTVSLTGKWIRGKGKCKQITHVMCVSDSAEGVGGECYSSVVLAQYRGVGSTSDSSMVAPAAISDSVTQPSLAFGLETHLGVDPASNGSENWTGYVGNISQTVGGNYTRTNYQESFIVPTPAIEPAFRDDRLLSTTVSYSVNIPTDSTEYEAYG